ncbi:MAG: helix-turn-helix transcriptional regulator [Pseudomonadota bacterium]
MATVFGERIRTRAKEKGLSISELQRRAGLGDSTIRNILSGQSKHPSAENMLAIAEVLGCSIQELMYGEKALKGEVEKQKVIPFEYPDLSVKCLQVIVELLAKREHNLSLDQVMELMKDIYHYSLENSPNKTVDKGFAKWFVERIL